MFEKIKEYFRPVLSDQEIARRVELGELFLTPISNIQLQPNSVDLTLASSYSKIRPNDIYNGEEIINPVRKINYSTGHMGPALYNKTAFNGKNVYCLEPGEFVLFASNEVLNIPNGIVAFVQGRSSIARLGIQTEQAGLIDAGFRGTITFEVYNETEYPIYLMEGMRVAQVYFFKAMHSKRIYGKDLASKYSSQIEATGSKIHMDLQDPTPPTEGMVDKYWAMPIHHVPVKSKDEQ